MSVKTIWVTGASSGIGEAMVKHYAKQGVKLIISSRRKEVLNKLKSELPQPENVTVVPLDLEDHSGMTEEINAVLSNHKVDILINNAGISQRSQVVDSDFKVFKRLVDINYLGTVQISQLVLKHFLKHKGGQFVVISSVAGKIGVPGRAGYSGSKFALHGYFDALRAEMHGNNIDVTMICPGYIQTNISFNALTKDGSPQNSMDELTNNGMALPAFIKKAVKAIDSKKPEVLIGGFRETKMAIWVSKFFPSLFRKMIVKAQTT